MTPLAQKFVRQLTLPIKDRSPYDHGEVLGRLDGVHCFDLTAIQALVGEGASALASDMKDGLIGVDDRMAFLPFPKTWLEFTDQYGRRQGIFIEQLSETKARFWQCFDMPALGEKGIFCRSGAADLPLLGGTKGLLEGRVWNIEPSVDASGQVDGVLDLKKYQTITIWTTLWVYAALCLINSPKIIGRKVHMPHRGLERRLARARGAVVGKYPLNAWTEIVLSVTPVDETGKPTQEGRLTGMVAFHWVRAHRKPSLGILVPAYPRGEPALGFKKSRYRLAA